MIPIQPPRPSSLCFSITPVIVAFVFLLLNTQDLRSEEGLENALGYCAKEKIFESAPESAAAGAALATDRFAPDRLIDLLHLKIDFTPDYTTRTISGTATLRFTPISKALRQLRLDAVDLEIEKVKASIEIQEFQVTEEHLEITFARPLPASEEATVVVTYHAEPQMGLYFRTPEMGYLDGDTHLWTQGQPERHRHWFPGYDYPNERFTSEVICHVPAGMTVLSNGHLVSQEKDSASGLVAFHWLQDKPHVNYLISVVAGNLEKLEDKSGDLPLAFYTVPSDSAQAANSFRDTAKIIAFFEKEIGVPYPWDKYYNVAVKDFIAGGMENTSVTTLTDNTLFTKATENLRTSHRLDAHEVAHQWFGDLLTCKDWSHLWLNEGFATFYQVLYEEEKFGREALQYGMFLNAKRVLDAKDDKPIVYRGYKDPMEQFDYRAYPKGAWVLHMLRSQLGESLYRRCIRTYVRRNVNRNVVTEDLNRVIEEESGLSFDRFFDQWVYHGGHPDLDVKYSWDALRKQAKLTVTQKQKMTARVPLFHFDLPVRIQTAQGSHDFLLTVDQASEDFFCKLPEAPVTVRLDPDYTLLARINFTPPAPLLDAQLKNEDDMMGRLIAVDLLSKKKDLATIKKLKTVLQNDPFHGVRIQAAKALRTIHSDEAFAALDESRTQKDARVRQEVVRALAGFYSDRARGILVKTVTAEKNPDIVTEAIGALGKYPSSDVSKTLLSLLNRDSYRSRIAGATMAAMRTQDSPQYIPALKKKLQGSAKILPSRTYGKGLDTLAYLSRNEEDRDSVRSFLADHLDHPKESVRVEAIRALGTLDDPRSLALLRSYPVEPTDRPENKAAAEAIRKLNGAKPQAKEVGDLRKEVLDLQKKLKDVTKKIETLEKTTRPAKAVDKVDSQPDSEK